ncbi:MAG: GtrA family protein [Deltaproteobacteria bacterium]|jgi:putative flippase GtrA|nr:GtrA family protein [Deltaproteobacteria bacterium]
MGPGPERPGRAGGLSGDALRFLLAGGLNTALTLAVYQLLLLRLSEPLSWSLAWAAGLAFVSVAYPRAVFRGGRLTWRRVLLNALWYGAGYALSLALLLLLVRRLGVHPRLAGLCVPAMLLPVNFAVSRLVFTAGRRLTD